MGDVGRASFWFIRLPVSSIRLSRRSNFRGLHARTVYTLLDRE